MAKQFALTINEIDFDAGGQTVSRMWSISEKVAQEIAEILGEPLTTSLAESEKLRQAGSDVNPIFWDKSGE